MAADPAGAAVAIPAATSRSEYRAGIVSIEIKPEGFENAAQTVDVAAGATVADTIRMAIGTRSESTTVDAELSEVPPLAEVTQELR